MPYTKMTQDIIDVLWKIPYGFVSSYSTISKIAGYGNGARQVVRILSSLSEKENLPWHRVVNIRGEIVLKDVGALEQINLLKSEGVTFVGEKTVDPKHFYTFG